jgi:hypothetical protein
MRWLQTIRMIMSFVSNPEVQDCLKGLSKEFQGIKLEGDDDVVSD